MASSNNLRRSTKRYQRFSSATRKSAWRFFSKNYPLRSASGWSRTLIRISYHKAIRYSDYSKTSETVPRPIRVTSSGFRKCIPDIRASKNWWSSCSSSFTIANNTFQMSTFSSLSPTSSKPQLLPSLPTSSLSLKSPNFNSNTSNMDRNWLSSPKLGWRTFTLFL
jgi:hypothetical protein